MSVQTQIDSMNRKLDLILEEVALQRAHRQEMDGLKGNLLRAGILDQLISFKDFLDDAAPLARESFIDLMNRLDEFDRKGYFSFLKEMGMVADTVVTSFSAEDVRKLGDNVVTILTTVKNVTQPQMLNAVNNALLVYRTLDMEAADDMTWFGLMREMRSPEVRRGLSLVVRFLKSAASHTDSSLNNA